ncbi:hypothetical protein GE21DRAFT_1202545 [Neurospora crassa]|nr:hypothetical protein B13N20.280 [imported] - Neurospora crassa [Neurospora crassa]KHE87164.1 hypothetical protein GE21DRAFT_1202545 [Neurospora crassa]
MGRGRQLLTARYAYCGVASYGNAAGYRESPGLCEGLAQQLQCEWDVMNELIGLIVDVSYNNIMQERTSTPNPPFLFPSFNPFDSVLCLVLDVPVVLTNRTIT